MKSSIQRGFLMPPPLPPNNITRYTVGLYSQISASVFLCYSSNNRSQAMIDLGFFLFKLRHTSFNNHKCRSVGKKITSDHT